MTTAKELAYKAYCDALIIADPRFKQDWGNTQKDYEITIKESFENWWKEWFYRDDHKDCFHPEHNVFINGKRYIQAD